MEEIGVILVTEPSCGESCKALGRIWDELALQYTKVMFIKIDASIRDSVFDLYGIKNVPSIVFVDSNGNALETIDGADGITQKEIADKLDQRGFPAELGYLMVAVNKIKENWYWFALGALVLVIIFLLLKRRSVKVPIIALKK